MIRFSECNRIKNLLGGRLFSVPELKEYFLNQRQRALFLILILTTVVIGVAAILIFALYEASFEQQRRRWAE
jgi:multisubunit Na+/H+ antiporter MnhC subunit